MSKFLTEKQILKQLGIKDFRHMSKDKFMSFVSLLPDMDPEVAKAAISQFPAYVSMAKSSIEEVRKSVDKAFDCNKSSMEGYHEACKTTLNALAQLLEKEDLSQEEQEKTIQQMREICIMIGKKDSENKAFLKQMAIIVGTLTLVVVGGSIYVFLSTFWSIWYVVRQNVSSCFFIFFKQNKFFTGGVF